MVLSGLDVFREAPDVTGPVGLLTNVASLTKDGRTAYRALVEAGVDVVALFAPEHGYYGTVAAGEQIADDRIGTLPIHSLYGASFSPAVEVLRMLSAVLVDLQDTGARWYTFVATLHEMLTACVAANIPVLVLDRPNPQGGIVVEGLRAEPEFFSLIAPASLPVRYGLTFGEVALWLNTEINAQVDVIRMDGWRRDMLYPETGLLWAAPSPGIPHPHTTLLYTGTCLAEGLNVSEGRGTPLPFEQIGAPFINGEALADEMNAFELPGAIFGPTWFQPAASKYANEQCQGIRIFITDPVRFQGFRVGLHMVEVLRRLYPEQIAWITSGDNYWFDRLVATTRIREALEAGLTAAQILTNWGHDAQAFQAESTPFWLYE